MSKKNLRIIIGALLVGLSSTVAKAQEDIYKKYDIQRNPLRVFLNKFSFSLTTGYSHTYYSHTLEDVYFFQNQTGQYIFNNDAESLLTNVNAYAHWLNDPSLQLSAPIDYSLPFDGVPYQYFPDPVNPLNPLIYALLSSSASTPADPTGPITLRPAAAPYLLVNTETQPLGFQGQFSGIPVTLQLHFNWWRLRIGGGYTYEIQFSRPLQPTYLQGSIRPYEPNFNRTRTTRWYGMLGYTFLKWWRYDFVAEVNYGRLKTGPQFNPAAISRNNHFNVGVSIEYNLSEYVRIIARPSWDIKSYQVRVNETLTIRHRNPTLYLQGGLSISIPEIPRSPMKSDHTQLKHVYTNPKNGKRKEVRGQSIWKRQNPKAGENHRRLNQHLPSRKNKVKAKKGS